MTRPEDWDAVVASSRTPQAIPDSALVAARFAARRPMEQPNCAWCRSFPCDCRIARTVDCACGGTITADDQWFSRLGAVTAHNAVEPHAGYLARGGLEGL